MTNNNETAIWKDSQKVQIQEKFESDKFGNQYRIETPIGDEVIAHEDELEVKA